MGFGWSKPRVSPIAIDFGADALKILQITEDEQPQIVAAASSVVPEDARHDLMARQAFYFEALRTLLKAQPFKGKRAICGIPAYQTLVQHLPITKTDGDDLEEQVGQQLRQRLNINPSRMVIRAHPVPGAARDGVKGGVICLAANRDVVLRYIEAVNRCKLDVVGMHCEPMMILRAFEHLFRREADKQRTTCFLDIGGATTKVIIAHGKEMVFAKTIHAAGDQLTREYAQAHELSAVDARQARHAAASVSPVEQEAADRDTFGQYPRRAAMSDITGARRAEDSRGSTTTATATAPAPSPGSAPAAVASRGDDHEGADVLDCLIDEIQLCQRFHQSIFPGRNIDKLVFLGGEARNAGNCQRIARTLGIGAQLGDPLARLTRQGASPAPLGVDTREAQPGWAVPVGLCLSEANL